MFKPLSMVDGHCSDHGDHVSWCYTSFRQCYRSNHNCHRILYAGVGTSQRNDGSGGHCLWTGITNRTYSSPPKMNLDVNLVLSEWIIMQNMFLCYTLGEFVSCIGNLYPLGTNGMVVSINAPQSVLIKFGLYRRHVSLKNSK